jgi:hypothetical protein
MTSTLLQYAKLEARLAKAPLVWTQRLSSQKSLEIEYLSLKLEISVSWASCAAGTHFVQIKLDLSAFLPLM